MKQGKPSNNEAVPTPESCLTSSTFTFLQLGSHHVSLQCLHSGCGHTTTIMLLLQHSTSSYHCKQVAGMVDHGNTHPKKSSSLAAGGTGPSGPSPMSAAKAGIGVSLQHKLQVLSNTSNSRCTAPSCCSALTTASKSHHQPTATKAAKQAQQVLLCILQWLCSIIRIIKDSAMPATCSACKAQTSTINTCLLSKSAKTAKSAKQKLANSLLFSCVLWFPQNKVSPLACRVHLAALGTRRLQSKLQACIAAESFCCCSRAPWQHWHEGFS